jgi:hypothetical protein
MHIGFRNDSENILDACNCKIYILIFRLLDNDTSVCNIPVKQSCIRKLQLYLTTYTATVKREEKLKEKMGKELKNMLNAGKDTLLKVINIYYRLDLSFVNNDCERFFLKLSDI